MKKAICFVLTLFILVTLLFTPVASSGYVGETETVQYSTKIGYITSKYTVIETKYITFEIPEGVYIPYNLEKYADSMYLAMEKVSGLSFINSFNSTRPVVRVMYTDSDISEFGPAYADGMIAVCSPGDLFLGKSYAILHELSHVLHHSQPYDGYATKGPGAILTEGFAEYTSYLTLKYLAENDPETYYAIEPIQNVINYRKPQPFPYEKDIQYWIKNGFDNSSMNYKVGLYLMAYLDNTYGNYTAWIPEVEKMPISPFLPNISPNDQIKAIANAYGTNALDGFYKWVKNNEKLFAYNEDLYLDMTDLSIYRIFPEFNAYESVIRLASSENYTVAYCSLLIELDALRYYLEAYKGFSTEDLVLHTDAKMIFAHYTNGSSRIISPRKEEEISLDGVSSLTLFGNAELTQFEIKGFKEKESIPETGYITNEDTVIETKYITFEIPEGVYVPYNLEKYADSMYIAMEKVSGLSFRPRLDSPRPVVRIRDEHPHAFFNVAICEPEDFFLGKSYAILHELSHVLHDSQPYDGYSPNYPGKIITEGFAEYTSYLTLKYLAENDPETYYAIEPIQVFINPREFSSAIYEKDIKYWIKNGFDDDFKYYVVGLHLMAYLDNTYGNYTAWIPEVAKIPISPFSGIISPDDQIKAIAKAYGTNALNGFYKWVKNNGTLFAYDDNLYLDMTKLIRYRIFPEYVISDIKIRLSIRDYNNYTVAYNGLTIELDALRHYLEEYKGLPADNLVLHSDAKMIYAHYTNGKTIVKFPWKGEIILDGVSSLTLVGYGELPEFEITDIGQ